MSDLISRQAVLDIVRDRIGNEYIVNGIKALPPVQPVPCDDCISRNDVIKMLNTMDRYTADKLKLCDTDKEFPHNEVFVVDDVYEELDLLPSVQPKKGEWIIYGFPSSEQIKNCTEDYYCSECKFVVSRFESRACNFCPNCGADMRGK